MSKLSSTATALKMPVLPLRDVVVFPHMVIPLFVGRQKSVKALELASEADKQVFLVAQKRAENDEPGADDIFNVGTMATILQLLKLPDGTVKVLVEGVKRGKILRYYSADPCFMAKIEPLESTVLPPKETDVMVRALMSTFEQYVKLNKKVPAEVINSLSGISSPSRLTDSITAHLLLKVEEKQKILELTDLHQRVEETIVQMETQIDLLEVEGRLRSRVKKEVDKSQREYFLNMQMKAIQEELSSASGQEPAQLEIRIERAGMPKEAKDKALSELHKLRGMSPMSAEATVVRNYLDVLLDVPWKKHSRINHDLDAATKILEDEHYGLKEVKERFIEYLAVQQRVQKLKGPILCLVGPPGVGKTSLGESIARATGRKFTRVSLGGVRDEAEIRGHRRTYIGALPGKIIQKMSKVGVRNPLFLLDEIDKMSTDFRGDPASALLEVLDPEQNVTFNDHYLEVDYDLSHVMFICTANTLNIPAPLLDRMEVIRIPGYTEDEKVHIGMRHLLPKQFALNGLQKNEISIPESVVQDIIRHYTREAGVRNLERAISKICRKVVKEILSETKPAKKDQKIALKTAQSEKINTHAKKIITTRNLEKYLGVQKFRFGKAEEHDQIGQVTGLAWTEVGGELLTIEAMVVPGEGKAIYTGQLGEVMQESIKAALTVVRSRSTMLGIPADFYTTNDIHVHVPEGATPKDGPSAGIGMCTALVSVLTKIPVHANIAMTGEITLRGEILPIGGLKEKLLAAHRGNIKTVIIPYENKRELKEIPDNITRDLHIKPMRWIDEVLAVALDHMPQPLPVVTVGESTPIKLPLAKAKKRKNDDQQSAH
jgi:ATP-dependent Lon protease